MHPPRVYLRFRYASGISPLSGIAASGSGFAELTPIARSVHRAMPPLVSVHRAMKLPPLVSDATPAVAAAAAAAPVRIHLGREHDRGPARGVVPRGRRALGRGLVPGAEVGRLRAALIPGDEPRRWLHLARGGRASDADEEAQVEHRAHLGVGGVCLSWYADTVLQLEYSIVREVCSSPV